MNSKLLRVVKRYCPLCDKEHEVEERERLSSINIKGECVKYKEVYFECKETNEEENEFVSAKMMDENLLRARDVYRKEHNMLTSLEIKQIRQKYGVTQAEFSYMLGLGEVMDDPAVIHAEESMFVKMNLFENRTIDGHAPYLPNKELSAYKMAGVDTDHEATTFEYALEEVRRGLHVHIREGSAAHNLKDIVEGIVRTGIDTEYFSFCTDDKHIEDILRDVEKKALVSLDGQVDYKLTNKIKNGKLYVDQGIIAGCAGGGFENICAAADILTGKNIGSDEFTLSVYPASMPVYMELIKNGAAASIMEAGGVMKTAFCGPCFGAGDTPANNAFSIRHSTRNFPNREGSKLQNGQIASVALMDARSIAATAANKGYLTAATDMDVEYKGRKYHFDKTIYENRVFDSHGVADPDTEIQFGPNIKDWPEMVALPENLIIKVVSEIHDPVTTTDELIPSGETSSFRSNPLGLAEFALSRKDPAYVGRAKEVQKAEKAREAGQCMGEALPELRDIMHKIKETYDVCKENVGVGSTIFAVKPGDGSAREQAASCQKVLGGWANIANEYATKRYRSNLINWGMLPFIIDEGGLPFTNGDYIFIPEIAKAVKEKTSEVKAYVVNKEMKEFTLRLGELTDDERQIILDGCLINFYRNHQ